MQPHHNNPRPELPPSKLPFHASLAPHELAHADEAYPRTSAEHRARLRRYVQGTVGACVVLCVAAVVRVGAARLETTPQAAQPVARATETTTQVRANLAQPTAPDPAPVSATGADATPASTDKPAPSDREAARHALESGKARDAVASAERAAHHDPGDAEAWLLLGAARAELGQARAARDAYRACTRTAKRGPVRECAAMLR
jgi:cytochrome c-type biogenesis protein CcmH/NrfG